MNIQTRLIDYHHGDVALRGELAVDTNNATARPGILIAPNWAGRSPQDGLVAERLAALGYAGFALDVYGAGVLGTSPEENTANMQPLLDDRAELQARLLAALTTLQAQPEVDASRCAIIGYCFGGLCALDMARCGAAVHGVVSFHGLFTPPANLDVGRITSKVLMLHGWDDPMATPDDVLAVSRELSAANADWQLHAYGGVMHSFTSPAADNPANGTVYDAAADQRSWQAMVNFLDELFADQ